MQENLAELMSSRICHDLISPIGAIGNGLELMSAFDISSPELELVGQSAHTAQSKLKFFRIAFGAGSRTLIGGGEAQRIAADMFAQGRMNLEFTSQWGDRERQLVKLFYLLLLCVETSLPRGGNVACTPTESGWEISVQETLINAPADLWAHIANGAKLPALTAKTIQFPLTRECLVARSINLDYASTGESLSLSF